jgi:hypothetical protein
MRKVNQADYLIHASDVGWLVDDAAWLLAGIEPLSIPPDHRDIPIGPRESLIKEHSQVVPDHLRDAVDLATDIKGLILADIETGKLPKYPEGKWSFANEHGESEHYEYASIPYALSPREWLKWAKSRGVNVSQGLLDAVKEETPEEFDMRLARMHWDLEADPQCRNPTQRLMELTGMKRTKLMTHVRSGKKLIQIENATKKMPVAK